MHKKFKFYLSQRVKQNNAVKKWINESMVPCIELKFHIIEQLLICNKIKILSTVSKLAKISKLKILNNF